jgi:hypothetical protein
MGQEETSGCLSAETELVIVQRPPISWPSQITAGGLSHQSDLHSSISERYHVFGLILTSPCPDRDAVAPIKLFRGGLEREHETSCPSFSLFSHPRAVRLAGLAGLPASSAAGQVCEN